MLGHGRVQLKQLIAKNIDAEKPKAATGRKVDNLMQVLRSL
jgi:hypothetical protein